MEIKYLLILLIVIAFASCAKKNILPSGSTEKLSKLQIDSIKNYTELALEIQDCTKLRKYLSSLFYEADCHSNSEFYSLRERVANNSRTEGMNKKRGGNNCINVEYYFDALCTSNEYSNLSNLDRIDELQDKILRKKESKEIFMAESILLGYSMSTMKLNEAIEHYKNQDIEKKRLLISALPHFSNYKEYFNGILEIEDNESLTFYIKAVLNH